MNFVFVFFFCSVKQCKQKKKIFSSTSKMFKRRILWLGYSLSPFSRKSWFFWFICIKYELANQSVDICWNWRRATRLAAAPLWGTTLIVMLLVLVQMYRIMGRGGLTVLNMHSSTALSFFRCCLPLGRSRASWVGSGGGRGGRVKGY